MAIPTIEGPEGEETLAAPATEPPETTGGNGPLGRLAMALLGWLSGKPLSNRDRARIVLLDGRNNWAKYW